jgi:hypothetical protein
MDFIDTLKQFSAKVDTLKSSLQTEEATKTALIMPFFAQVLGYDVFNPLEFCPEYIADVGSKKGEKVDYAILFDGKPVIIIEAKWSGIEDELRLDKHGDQLFRYFGTEVATRFGILTNGIIYKFYTDLKDKNVMDLTPFLEINLLNLRDSVVPELKLFCKSYFNSDEVFNHASKLRYSNEIRQYFTSQLAEPSDDFVRLMISSAYSGKKTKDTLDDFRPLVKSTLKAYIDEVIRDKMLQSLNNSTADKTEEPKAEVVPEPIPAESKVVTTEEEIEAFYIIKAILSENIDVNKITYKDTQSYFAVLYAGMPTKWICRVRLGNKRFISFPNEQKEEVYTEIASVQDIYGMKEQLTQSAKRFIKETVEV